MKTESAFNYLKIEIPEYDDRISSQKIGYFKIYGIEKERPLIRINNCFVQGRWIKKKNFIILTRKNIKFLDLISNSESSIFEERKKMKIKFIKLKKKVKNDDIDSENFFISKKLKLYKLPLIVK